MLDSLDDILVHKANIVELKGLTLNNIETFVVEPSLLSAIGIACVAPLILELNDAKSESKENDKIYPSLDYIEQQTTLNSIIISTLINTKSFIVELLINRPVFRNKNFESIYLISNLVQKIILQCKSKIIEIKNVNL